MAFVDSLSGAERFRTPLFNLLAEQVLVIRYTPER